MAASVKPDPRTPGDPGPELNRPESDGGSV
jgi:hypothetical protein